MLLKICGITNIDDARYALDAGADWIGLNLVAGPRRIDISAAEAILSKLDDPSRVVVLVHLTRGALPDQLPETLRGQGVRRIQIYGDPVADAVRRLSAEGFESILVHHVGDEASLASLDVILADCRESRPKYVLFDASSAKVGGRYTDAGRLGGTGRRADWDAIAHARSIGRDGQWPTLLLAGGLTPANVAQAIRKLSPAGVDVSSGVELRPGRKSSKKIAAFVAAVRDCETD